MRWMLALSIFVSVQCFGQVSEFKGPVSGAMGGTGLAISSAWSTVINPAGMTDIAGLQVATAYQSHFLLPGVSSQGLVLATPLEKHAVGLSLQSFGYKYFRQSHVRGSYALKLSDQVSMGLYLGAFQFALGNDYGNRTLISAGIGLMAKVTEKTTLAATIREPMNLTIDENELDRVPASIEVGLLHRFGEHLTTALEVENNLSDAFRIKGGMEYDYGNYLVLRLGVSTNPAQMAYGFGVNLSSFRVDLSNTYNTQMGHMPQIGIRYMRSK